MGLWESGAILIYLANKSGKFFPKDLGDRYQTLQWLMFQMGGLGPMIGQVGFFHKFAGKDFEDRRPFERYRDESRRLVKVLEGQLEKSEYVAGDEYTIADIASWPWVRTISGFYDAAEEIEMHKYPKVNAWLDKCKNRPASLKAINIPARD